MYGEGSTCTFFKKFAATVEGSVDLVQCGCEQ